MRPRNTSFMEEFPYIYRGIVLDNKDPKNLGRCKIKVPSIHGESAPADHLPWSRCISNIAIGSKRGSASIPDIEDIVWVLFEGGDKDSPIYIGGTHGIEDIPLNSDEIVLYQENKDRIYYNRESRVFDIKIGDIHIIVDPEKVNIKGDTIIEGDTRIEGNLHVTGLIISDTDVQSNDISLVEHTHSNVVIVSDPGDPGKPV